MLPLVIHLSQNMFFMSFCLAYFLISFELVERRALYDTVFSPVPFLFRSVSLSPSFLRFSTFILHHDDDDIASCRVVCEFTKCST